MRYVIAANTISQLIGKVIGAGTTFFISVLLARQFGVSGYGDFVKITTYIAFFFLIADFGLNAIYLQKQKDPSSFPTLLGSRIIGGLILVFLAISILAFFPHGESQGYTDVVRLGIILFSPAIFFQGLITSANAIFQKNLRYDIATISLTLGSIAAVGLLMLLIQFSSSAAIVGSLVLLVGSIITATASLFGIKRLGESLTISFSFGDIRALFLHALPLGLTLLFALIYGHIDSIILTLTRTTGEVGIYGLAYKVFELMLVFPTFFMNAAYPLMLKTISNKQEAGNTNFKNLVKKSFFFLLTASCFLSIMTWICAPLLIYIQEGFAASIAPLRVLSLSLPLFFLSSLTMWALIALKKQALLVIVYGGVMVLNVSLNIWLIPQWGYMAAAWITLLSEALVLGACGFFLSRYIRNI